MRILFIGDVVSMAGCQFIREHLPGLRKSWELDFVIANGENSADGNGITPKSADHLLDSGIDCLTTGNLVFRRREVYPYLEREEAVIRPANYNENTPGRGYTVLEKGKYRVFVFNLMGTVYMQPLANPFLAADEVLRHNDCPVSLLDFHAEATGEKAALAHYLDGRVTAVLGTHTHVPTADACILPKGTGFISDAGMTGPENSILGIRPDIAITKMRDNLPVRFEYAQTPIRMDCVLLDIDYSMGKLTKIEHLCVQ